MEKKNPAASRTKQPADLGRRLEHKEPLHSVLQDSPRRLKASACGGKEKGRLRKPPNAFLCVLKFSQRDSRDKASTPAHPTSTALLAQPQCTYTRQNHDEGQGTRPWVKS